MRFYTASGYSGHGRLGCKSVHRKMDLNSVDLTLNRFFIALEKHWWTDRFTRFEVPQSVTSGMHELLDIRQKPAQ